MADMSTNKLIELYDKILKVNLTDDSYTIIKYDVESEKDFVANSKTISEWFLSFVTSGHVYSEDISLFKRYTALSYLRNFFMHNNNHWVQYRRKYGSKYCWCEMLMIATDDYTDDNQEIYLFVKKLNEASSVSSDDTFYIKSKKVLIIEEDEADAKELARIISSVCAVVKAKGADDAYSILRDDYKDIFAIIGRIGDEDEVLEYIKLLKKNTRYDSIPVIVTTSDYSQEHMAKCLEYGAFDIVMKPYSEEVVKNKINNLAKLKYSMAMLNAIKIDPLTNLYSKEYFFQKVEEILDLNPNKSYRIVCTDIEDFRLVNENYGADLGDKTLRYIAEHISDVMPNVVVGGRLSGDVFAFLREDIPFKYNVDAWKRFRQEAPVSSIIIKYGLSTVDRSLGVQTMCDHSIEAAKSIKKMYDTPFAEYTKELKDQKQREKQIIDHMDKAIEQKQFEMYYQPKLDLKQDKIGGAEALIRWKHPIYGFLSPAEFIPLFEKNGFIYKLDMYALESVCMDIREWMDNSFNIVPISINLSRRDFENKDLLKTIDKIVKKYGVDPSLIHFEVTESAFSNNIDQVSEMVDTLSKEGYVIELDDFGSGYSSLTMLNNINLDVLKIDKSILNDGSNKDNKILQFCIQIAKILELKTIAEGVETKQQLEELKSMGCNSIQGYYYSKPLPKQEFTTYLII